MAVNIAAYTVHCLFPALDTGFTFFGEEIPRNEGYAEGELCHRTPSPKDRGALNRGDGAGRSTGCRD